MKEGLKADKARDATFLLTGAGAWVGKSAYLTADPMTLQEGKRAIVHAISDHGVKARGVGHPRVNPPAQPPFRFNTSRASPPGDQSAHEVPLLYQLSYPGGTVLFILFLSGVGSFPVQHASSLIFFLIPLGVKGWLQVE